MASAQALAAALDAGEAQPAQSTMPRSLFGLANLVRQPTSFNAMYPPGIVNEANPLPAYDQRSEEQMAALVREMFPEFALPIGLGRTIVDGVGSLAMQANEVVPWGGNNPSAIGLYPEGQAPDAYVNASAGPQDAGMADPSLLVPFATDVAGAAMTGSFAAPAVSGGLGMGVRARPPTALPMDLSSQLERAKTGGFRMDMPLYKGMDQDVTGFDPAYRGTASGSLAAKEGFSVALDPETASEFAMQAKGERPGNGQIYPLRHRAERPVVLRLDGDETDKQIAGVLRDAWDAGHDAVLMRNYTTPDGLEGKTILWVKDESQLRSPNANFDPAKRSSRNLLAANPAGSAPVGATVLGGGQDSPSSYTTGGRF